MIVVTLELIFGYRYGAGYDWFSSCELLPRGGGQRRRRDRPRDAEPLTQGRPSRATRRPERDPRRLARPLLLESRYGPTATSRRRDVRDLPARRAAGAWDVARLPYTLRILLENVLRNGDGRRGGGGRRLGRGRGAVARDLLLAGARPAAGLHRRARASSTSPRCATRCATRAATRSRSTR